jgi:hypothetical protein
MIQRNGVGTHSPPKGIQLLPWCFLELGRYNHAGVKFFHGGVSESSIALIINQPIDITLVSKVVGINLWFVELILERRHSSLGVRCSKVEQQPLRIWLIVMF